jgi:hypothetical protein
VSSPSRRERLLLVLTPAVAMTAVALGLRLGARGSVRAAIVYGAPPATGAHRLAWQVVVFDEDQGAREPVPALPLHVRARSGDAASEWEGETDRDGVAEALLGLPRADGVELEVGSGAAILAAGDARPSPGAPRAATQSGWLRFARRAGAIALDAAALGQRVAPGVPAELWVRASDAATHAPLRDVAVALDADTSLAFAPTAPAAGRTDSRGWVRIVAIPVGLAVTVTLRAKSPDARSGEWIGGLFMSPGAPGLDVAARTEPGAPIPIGVTMPTARSTAYLEIDDAAGRAWAATPALTAGADGAAGQVLAPGLAAGLYWAVAAADPAATEALGAGTLARPFFVASSDEAALRLGTGGEVCATPRDPRETASAVSACLALSTLAPVPRWVALDGFLGQRALDRLARERGLAVALGALAVAVVLEATLLMRVSGRSRARTVAVAVLVGLLGFALLAAFIVRV